MKHLFFLLLFSISPSVLAQSGSEIPLVTPESVGMDATRLNLIDDIVQEGLEQDKMPGCVVMIGGKISPQQTGPVTAMESTHQPAREMLLSVPQRQRNWTFCPTAEPGRFTSTVLKVAFVPVQAERAPRALPEVSVWT